MLVACGGQFTDKVALRRPFRSRVVGQGAVEEAETVTMLCRHGYVFHAAFDRQFDNGVSIEFPAVKLLAQSLIFCGRNLLDVQCPFTTPEKSSTNPSV